MWDSFFETTVESVVNQTTMKCFFFFFSYFVGFLRKNHIKDNVTEKKFIECFLIWSTTFIIKLAPKRMFKNLLN